jgi:hypothetical protein
MGTSIGIFPTAPNTAPADAAQDAAPAKPQRSAKEK